MEGVSVKLPISVYNKLLAENEAAKDKFDSFVLESEHSVYDSELWTAKKSDSAIIFEILHLKEENKKLNDENYALRNKK